MKHKIFLNLVFVLTIAFSANAQLDRRIGGTRPQVQRPVKQEKPDYAALAVNRMKEDLSLDSFQEAVITGLLNDNQEKMDKIMAEDIPLESKTAKIHELNDIVRSKIRDILTPEQIVKFESASKKKKK